MKEFKGIPKPERMRNLRNLGKPRRELSEVLNYRRLVEAVNCMLYLVVLLKSLCNRLSS